MDATFTAEILQARVDQLETQVGSLRAKLKLARDEALEEAAQVADHYAAAKETALSPKQEVDRIAAAIRELKTK